MTHEYTRGHMVRIGALNGLIFLIGLMTFAFPFISKDYYPGALDTTDHVTLGALICVLAIFRATVAFGSVWIDVCLFALGLISAFMPTIMHMRWDGHYNFANLFHGGVIMACSVISTILTLPVLRRRSHA